MKVIRQFLKVAGIFTFLLFFVTQSFGYSVKSFKLELRNDYLVSANVYEFDVYLLNTSTDPTGDGIFELANVQFGINVPSTFRAGGTIAVSMVPGTSELNASQQPAANKFSFQNTRNVIIMTAMANPGTGMGSIISYTDPGTRVARVRLTNTVSFGLTCPMSLTYCFVVASCGYPTKVSAYQNGLATDVSSIGTFTTGYLCNPCVNKPLDSYNVTGSGTYCEGGSGLAVGLSGSETGVTYTMNPGAVVLPGTGAALNFGTYPAGDYTVSAARNCTYISGSMTGSAAITMINGPAAAGPISGSATATEGSTGNAYSVGTIANAVSYVWSVTGGTATINGQGTPNVTLDFPMGQCNQTVQLHVYGQNQCGNGIDSFFDIFLECAGSAPVAYNVTGGGAYCAGGNGLPVGLDGSETGVTYELYKNAAATGTTLPGDGNPLSFGNQLAGTYTVYGTNSFGNTWMTGNAVITEDPQVTPTFAQLGPYCVGDIPGTLPGTSIEGITGTWDPAAISTSAAGTTTYTFTPDAGQCATTATMDVVVNAWITPTFAQLGPYCVGDTPGTLPSVSIEGYDGSWNPSLINTAAAGTTTYTFYPAPGQGCITTATMDVVVNAWITPTFAQLGPYCVNDNPGTLPSASIEGYTGTWNPATISTTAAGTTTYTFTPDAGQGCISTATMDVVVNAWITPTFAQLGPYCVNDNPGTLPSASIEGYTGTWNPAVINTGAAGTTTYTFTPDAGQGCITTATMDIVVNEWIMPLFYQLGPYCVGETPGILMETSMNGIHGTWNPAGINTGTPGTTTYTFTPDPGQGCVSIATMDVVVSATSYVWNGSVNNDWHNPLNWTPNGTPLCCSDVQIPAGLNNYPTLMAAGACHDIFVDMGATLVDNGLLVVCGTADVKRCYTQGTADWHLIGSPISNGLSGLFAGRYLQSFTAPNTWTDITSLTQPLNVMEGYAMWCDNCPTNCIDFIGNLNLGEKSKNVTPGWNLLSNPFVASIDWNVAGQGQFITPSVWYLEAATGNYLVYNTNVGGTGSQYVPPTQGFFVMGVSTAAGSFDLTNAAKSHMSGNLFYKSEDPGIVIIEAKGKNYKDQTWVRFNEQENAAYDGQTDVAKIISVSNPQLPQIYTTIGNEKMTINSMPQTSTVPMGFTAVASGSFTINAPQTGLCTKVTLEDLFNGTMTDLMTSSYTFTYTTGDQENRFLLHFNGVGVDNNQADLVNIYSSEKTAYVAIPANRTGDVKIMNMLGQNVKEGKLSSVLTKFNLNETGIYVVQATVNGKVYTQKVIIR